MPSTNNATKIEDPEKQALASISSTSSTQSNDDRSLPEAFDELTKPKMSRLQHIFLCCVLLAIFTFTVSSAAANGALKTVSLEEKLRFQELLDTIEPSVLHEILHEHLNGKYQHGVYQEDKIAMEVVHQTNAEVAQSLVELAKRQSNSTASTTPSSTSASSTPDGSTTSQAQVTPSTSETTTQQQASQSSTTTAQQSTQAPASTSTSSTTAVVPSTSAPTKASSTTTTTQASTTTVPSTSATTDNSNTPTPTRSVTQQIVYTTTLANGAPTTVTSITIVPADQADKTGGSATKSAPNASLQTNGGNSKTNLGLTGILGAIGIVVVGAL